MTGAWKGQLELGKKKKWSPLFWRQSRKCTEDCADSENAKVLLCPSVQRAKTSSFKLDYLSGLIILTLCENVSQTNHSASRLLKQHLGIFPCCICVIFKNTSAHGGLWQGDVPGQATMHRQVWLCDEVPPHYLLGGTDFAPSCLNYQLSDCYHSVSTGNSLSYCSSCTETQHYNTTSIADTGSRACVKRLTGRSWDNFPSYTQEWKACDWYTDLGTESCPDQEPSGHEGASMGKGLRTWAVQADHWRLNPDSPHSRCTTCARYSSLSKVHEVGW